MRAQVLTMNDYNRGAFDVLSAESRAALAEVDTIHADQTVTYVQDTVYMGDKVTLYRVMTRDSVPHMARKAVYWGGNCVLRAEYDERGNMHIVE